MTARVSVMTQGSNLFQTSAEDLNAIATDFISDGIVGAVAATSGVAPMTGGLAVNAQGTPDRTVAITAGKAYVTATPTSQASQRLRVSIDAQNLTHATNSTGGTRYDWIYVQVSASLAANPALAGDTTGTLVISRSTSSVTDNGTPPTYGYHIATVTLTNGYTTIVNGNIADTRVRTGANSAGAATITPAMLSFSGATATRTTSQSISHATFTAILFDSEVTDTDSYHSTSSNTSRLTVPATGQYRVTYNGGFVVAAAGSERSFWVAVNGSGGAGANRYAVTSVGPNVVNARSASIELPLTAGDYVELFSYQDCGVALGTASEATSPGQMRMSIQRLS